MRTLIFIAVLLSLSFSYAQVRVATHEIYNDKKLAYNGKDGTLFTGIAESRNKKGHLAFEDEYVEGYKIRRTLYYNTDEIIKAEDIYFHEKSFEKKHTIHYSSDGKDVRHIYFDKNGKKSLKENYENEKLVYSCEYHDGKKHGTEFCISDEGPINNRYTNGKKIRE